MSTETTATTKKTAVKQTVEPKAEPNPEVPAKSKSKMTWAERMAALPEDEAKTARAKAAEASRISKAKKRGTTPVVARTMRLKAKLARNNEQTELLRAEREKLEAELAEIEAGLVASAEHETAEDEGTDSGEA